MRYIEKHPIIMIVVGVLGISLSSIFVKYSSAPSAVTAAFRLIWTVLFLLPVVLGKTTVRKELFKLPGKTVMLSSLSGLFLAIHFVLWFESLHHTSVASSTTIVCTEVIWVCLGFCLFLKGKLSIKAIAAIAVTLVGSGFVAYADSGEGSQLYGDILALLAAIAVAVYTLIGRVVRNHTSTTVYTFLVYVACCLVLVLICLFQGYELFNHGLSPILVGALLAIFSTILGHSIFSWCLKFFSPSFVSASKLCEPVAAAVMAAFLFGEMPIPLQLLGGGLILGGVYWYSRIERKGK
jgi:drug/metabolite transporter (DMT)-like permease